MDERAIATDLVDRIVRHARVPGSSARESLRFELAGHFEDAAATPEGLGGALREFGSEAAIAEAFRSVYRIDFVGWYLIKLAAGVTAVTAAGLLFMTLTHVRFDGDALALASGFTRRAANLFKLVVGATIAWELGRSALTPRRVTFALVAYVLVAGATEFFFRGGLQYWHFWNIPIMVCIGCGCSRFERRPVGLFLTFCGFVLNVQVFVLMRDLQLITSLTSRPDRTLLTAVECLVAWIGAATLLPRFDELFSRFFEPSPPR